MSLKKRHMGRRVAGIGVGVALMVLGLEAPAFAANAVLTSFSPTSGPEGCVVIVTGTGFTDFPDTDPAYDVDFLAQPGGAPTPAATFDAISGTELWVTVPDLAAGTDYKIRVTNPTGTGTSATTFLATTDGTAGGCAPTITSFLPVCGGSSTAVVITGTNLLESDLSGGDVRFAPYSADALTVQPDVDTQLSLSVVVPSGSADGAIRVQTYDNPAGRGQVFSTTAFQVPPPDCVAPTGHTRAITFKLKKSGKASGVVSSTETTPFTACVNAVDVKIQKKKKGGGWKTAASATTSDTGSYSAKTKGKPGKYRALAPKQAVGTPATDCLKAKSATRTIK